MTQKIRGGSGVTDADSNRNQTNTPDASETQGDGATGNDPAGGALEEVQPENNADSAGASQTTDTASILVGSVSAAEIGDTAADDGSGENIAENEDTVADSGNAADEDGQSGNTDSENGQTGDANREDVQYFSRDVYVVAGADGFYIGHDAEPVKIAVYEELYTLVEKRESELETETGAEQIAVSEEQADDPETETDVETDGNTENDESEYELVLTKPELLTGQLRVTDDTGALQSGATFTVTDDSELRAAVRLVTGDDGIPVIEKLDFGTYTITVTATDPQTGRTASCERTVTVEGISFEAPTLYIGTKNTDYDLTADLNAMDENGIGVDVYVKNQDELVNAKETIVDETTGEETTRFIKGIYYVTLAAIHPASGIEYTFEREVEVVDGYYLYAPVLTVEQGSTDYDLTEGVELRDADTEEVVEHAEITVEDMSDLYRGMIGEEDTGIQTYAAEENLMVTAAAIDTDSTKTSETDNAKVTDTMPALTAGEYTVTLSAVNPDDRSDTITVVRTLSVVTYEVQSEADLTMDFEATAYSDRLTSDTYKSGKLSNLGGIPSMEVIQKQLGLSSSTVSALNNTNINTVLSELPEAIYEFRRICQDQASNRHAPTDVYLAKYATLSTSLAEKAGGRNEFYVTLMQYLTGTRRPVYVLLGLSESKILQDYGKYWKKGTVIATNRVYNYTEILPNLGESPVAFDHESTFIYSSGYTGLVPLSTHGTMLDKPKYAGEYIANTQGDWNNFVNGKRTIATLRNGGKADITLTPFKDVSNSNLDIANLDVNILNVTPESSVLVEGAGINFILPYNLDSGTETRPMVLPNIQYWLKGFQLKKGDGDARVAYTLQDNTWFKLEDLKATTTAADKGNTWKTSGGGDLEFVANDGVETINLYSENQKTVKITQTGDHTNTSAVKGFTQSLTLELSNGASTFLNLTSGDTTSGTGNTTRLTLKGTGGTAKMTTTVGDLWDSGADNGTIKTGILDVQTDSFTILKAAGQADSEPVITVYNQLLSNGRQISVGQSDGTTFTDGEVIAKSTGEKLDATDFTTDAVNQAANIYPMNLDDYTVIAKKLNHKPIEVLKDGTDRKTTTDTYKEAFDWIQTNGDSGNYTVKIHVPRNYGADDVTALMAVTTAKAAQITLEAADGSHIDNDYMRMRAASALETLELPTAIAVEFKNIAVRRSNAEGTSDEQIVFVNNANALTINGDYKTVGDQAEIYGGSSTADSTANTIVTVNAGIFQTVYGGSMATHSHSGKAGITIGAGATVTTVNGASSGETAKPAGKTAEITLTAGAKPANVYNYDKMSVNGAATISGQLDSEKVKTDQGAAYNGASYSGETILNADATLTLSNDRGIRKMGSLKLAETAANGAVFEFAKQVGTASATNNDFLVTLTNQSPVTAFAAQVNKITVRYTNNTKPTAGDIVFYLPNAGKSSVNVHTRALEDGFGGVDAQNNVCRMVPSAGNNTIVMRNVSVGLIASGNPTQVNAFMSVADAIKDAEKGMLKQETDNPGQDYTITFFADGYAFTAEDLVAAESMLGNATVGKVTWTAKIDASGAALPDVNTVYGLEGQVSLFGTSIVLKDIVFSSGTDLSIFAEGRPLTVETGVRSVGNGTTNLYGGGKNGDTTTSALVIKSGNFGTIYGGGTKAHNGDTSIMMSGGTATAIYGGGSGAGGTVTGNTTVKVDGGDVTGGSIYGGGKGAAVTGNTAVTCVSQNGTTARTDLMQAISGSGTDDAGTLAENVAGTKSIIFTAKGRTNTAGLVVTDLAGFDTLEIGVNAGTAISYEKALLRVTGRFDSKAVDDGAADRTAKVTLRKATLITGATTQGHIGQLITDGESLLVVARKEDNSTMPLLVDQKSNDIQLSAKLKLAVLESYDNQTLNLKNQLGDRLVQFTNTKVADTEYKKYEDALSTRLAVVQTNENGNVYIEFDARKSHIATGWIEYTDDMPDTLTAAAKPKKIHILYDKENEHEIMTDHAAGYIVALPKDKVNETEAANYTVMDTQFIKNGTFSAAVQALNPYKITATVNQAVAGTHGKHQATAEVDIPNLDPGTYWYVMHIMCEDGDTMTTVLDVDAPQKAETDVKMEFDSENENYIYELRLSDKDYPDRTQLPTTKPGDADANENRLTYTANGITAAYWSVGNLAGTDTTAADQEAVKLRNQINAQPGTNGLYDMAKVVLLADGVSQVPGGATAKVTVTVPKAVVDAHKQDAVWVYVKDAANNTVKLAIPLNDNIIDVSVPMTVNVIAVKKSDPGATTELLAPICEVKNNSAKTVEVQIAGFKTTVEQDKLSLVNKEKADTFAADELALFIKGAGATTMAETNVKTLDAKPVTLGTLGKNGSQGSTANYTFDAGYHVNNINVPDGFIRNTMSYRFRIAGGN